MQGLIFATLGLLGVASCQQPAMPERRDICLVNCGEGWCCVSGQKCVAGPSKEFSTPFGCEDEILGWHTTWEAYRGDFKEFSSTTLVRNPEPTTAPISRSTTRSSTTTKTITAIIPTTIPDTRIQESPAGGYVETLYPEPWYSEWSSYSQPSPSEPPHSPYPTYSESSIPESSSSAVSKISSASFANSTGSSPQGTESNDAPNIVSTSTTSTGFGVPTDSALATAAAGRVNIGIGVAVGCFLVTLMGF